MWLNIYQATRGYISETLILKIIDTRTSNMMNGNNKIYILK